eukprot:TRINITY_DN49574_c0_g1_i1.p1 TRINITY_DN49574_c0_g1~~TRINITY_DN49574_c0_g1_i1.p1  ORF type:complete len:279 (+),score=51.52 TRINITY_DN49574_c0_g1_i1:175-1011(+)
MTATSLLLLPLLVADFIGVASAGFTPSSNDDWDLTQSMSPLGDPMRGIQVVEVIPHNGAFVNISDFDARQKRSHATNERSGNVQLSELRDQVSSASNMPAAPVSAPTSYMTEIEHLRSEISNDNAKATSLADDVRRVDALGGAKQWGDGVDYVSGLSVDGAPHVESNLNMNEPTSGSISGGAGILEEASEQLQRNLDMSHDTLVDALQLAELSSVKKAVNSALAKLRVKTIAEFDRIAHLEAKVVDSVMRQRGTKVVKEAPPTTEIHSVPHEMPHEIE